MSDACRTPMLFLLAIALPTHAACDDPVWLGGQAQVALTRDHLGDAQAALTAAWSALSCSRRVRPEDLARLWLAQGALQALLADEEGAKHLFAAAARTAPELWVPDYGAELRGLYNEARSLPQGEPGTVTLDPPVAWYAASLDGVPTAFPASAPPGPHVIQVGPPDKDAVFATVFELAPGGTHAVTTGITEPPPPITAASVSPETRARVEDRSAALRLSAASEWSRVEALSTEASGRAEGALEGFIQRYADATVRVDGDDWPVEIPQVRAAREALASLPARRAAREAEPHAPFPVGLDGPHLTLGAALTRAMAADSAAAFGGPGLRLGLGLDLHLPARLGLSVEGGSHGLRSPAPVDGAPATQLSLLYATAARTWRAGPLQLQAGPTYAWGVGAGSASRGYCLTDPDGCADAADSALDDASAVFSVRTGGITAGATWRAWDLGPFSFGPALQAGALNDTARWYPWASLSLAVLPAID